ncbi:MULTISPECIES: hypothetical protein [Acinetobacter]|nr:MULTISPECIES: hypothetical protein [Acinetobacter]MCH7303215.1 DUF4735 domain-containing protein [Acinetobacter higginsii]MCH7318791.1 DUF4735 domain-containing protein [Acinetobacter higginsii]MCI3879880.1 DUF4735 domain-containing protein [Acinetobacter higginsii]
MLCKLFIFFLTSIFFCSNTSAGNNKNDYNQSIKSFEKSIYGRKVYADVAFLVGQAAILMGKPPVLIKPLPHYIEQSNSFPEFIEYYLWTIRDKKLKVEKLDFLTFKDIAFKPELALRLNTFPLETEEYNRQVKKSFLMMGYSITCSDHFDENPLISPLDYGYVTTHQILALVIAKDKGCVDNQPYQQALPLLINRLKAEFDVETKLNDLQIERAAILALIGRVDMVPAEFIQRIVDTQRSDGYWLYNDEITPRIIPKEHTSALAYFLLVAYRDNILQKKESKLKNND